LREQLQKKVYRWSVLAKDGLYTDKILNRFEVKSWATLSAERRTSAKKLIGDSSSDSSSESSGSDSEESKESLSDKVSVVSDKTPSHHQERTEQEESRPPTIVETRTAEVEMSVRSPSKPLPRNTSEYTTLAALHSCSLLSSLTPCCC
jgi:hypothetical protein